MPAPMPALLAGMETYDSAIEMDESTRTFDVPLTRLETFVREQVGSQSACRLSGTGDPLVWPGTPEGPLPLS
jgi:hypothetical protein